MVFGYAKGQSVRGGGTAGSVEPWGVTQQVVVAKKCQIVRNEHRRTAIHLHGSFNAHPAFAPIRSFNEARGPVHLDSKHRGFCMAAIVVPVVAALLGPAGTMRSTSFPSRKDVSSFSATVNRLGESSLLVDRVVIRV